MNLESGPAKADRNWQLVRAVLFLGFALFFIYDGAIRYPSKNRKEAELFLRQDLFQGQVKYDDLRETPTEAQFDKLRQTDPTTRAQVHDILGTPVFTHREAGGYSTDEYFMSRYGHTKVTLRNDRITASTAITPWQPWFKTKSEVVGQFYWAIIPALPGLYFLWRLYKAVTLRVVIDDEGMVYDRRRISFDSMVALQDYSPKGWIDLYYKAEAGQRKLRLDNEKVRLFDDIVAAICQAKGFENEVQAYAEKKTREEAEEAAAEDAAVADSAAARDDDPGDDQDSEHQPGA